MYTSGSIKVLSVFSSSPLPSLSNLSISIGTRPRRCSLAIFASQPVPSNTLFERIIPSKIWGYQMMEKNLETLAGGSLMAIRMTNRAGWWI
jgi:hypothetical protein